MGVIGASSYISQCLCLEGKDLADTVAVRGAA
jgi:hypothetical protein